MADLIDRQVAIKRLRGDAVAKYPSTFVMGLFAAADELAKLPTVDAVEVGSCDGCAYGHRKRPQKCSCCRRNPDMKDCYEEGG